MRTSPSSAILSSSPSIGRPTEPSRKPSALLSVHTPDVSVSPQASMIVMPQPAQKRTTSMGMGAVALAVQARRSMPARRSSGSSVRSLAEAYEASSSAGTSSPRSWWPARARARSLAASMAFRWSPGSCARTARTEAASFSHTRGTPKNCTGRSSRTAAETAVGSAHSMTCEARSRGR